MTTEVQAKLTPAEKFKELQRQMVRMIYGRSANSNRSENYESYNLVGFMSWVPVNLAQFWKLEDLTEKQLIWKEGITRFLDNSWVAIKLANDSSEGCNLDLIDKLIDTLPHVSTVDKEFIAYYPDYEKMKAAREVRTKIGRYASRVLSITDSNSLTRLSTLHQMFTGTLSGDNVKFIANDDREGWLECYNESQIRSCMANTNYNECVGTYAAASYGLPDNGLSLAYLGASPSKAVARTIVNQEKKVYLRVYGDERLGEVLEALGYRRDNRFLEDVFLAYHSHGDESFLAPYLDGHCDQVGIEEIQGEKVLRIMFGGDYTLNETSGLVSMVENSRCEDCGEPTDEDDFRTVVTRYHGHVTCAGPHNITTQEWCRSCTECNATYVEDATIDVDYISDSIVDDLYPESEHLGERIFIGKAVEVTDDCGYTDYVLEELATYSEHYGYCIIAGNACGFIDGFGHTDWAYSKDLIYSELRDSYILAEDAIEFRVSLEDEAETDWDYLDNVYYSENLKAYIHEKNTEDSMLLKARILKSEAMEYEHPQFGTDWAYAEECKDFQSGKPITSKVIEAKTLVA